MESCDRLLETDKQRRWWFANHPEYGSSRTGHRHSATSEDDRQGDKVSPHEVDEYVDYALQHVDGPLAAFLQSIKRNFGTEGQVTPPTMLAGGVFTPADSIWGPAKLMGGGGLGGRGGFRGSSGGIRNGGGGASPGGSGGGRGGPAKTGGSSSQSGGKGEPGKWVEKCRGKIGLEHQSKMSGQTIKESNGKLYIKEYEVRGVHFDDYRNGKLIEYKGPHGKLINKQQLFYHWVTGVKKLRDQALRQVEAAEGVPVIWKVGPNLVKAFDRVLLGVRGVAVQP